MDVGRCYFAIPDLRGDCKGYAGAIGPQAADVTPPIEMPARSRKSGKGETRGIDLDLPRVLE
jgi:hypothetical protein